MKRLSLYITAVFAAAAAATGCQEARPTYSDAEYVMFADTMSLNIIQQDARTFTVPVASTVACDYDRNFGVEIIDSKSKAVEGLHYTMPSNTVTIKAGERVANLEITANYDEIGPSDTLNIAMRLIMPEAVKWNLYGDETNVKMVKRCPWVIEDYTGWCVVTSMFLYSYPGENSSMQRLIYTEKHPTEANTIILHNFLYDGYDITLKFLPDDPAEPFVTMDEGQVLSDTQSVFWTNHGDDKLLVAASPYYDSYFNACEHFVNLYIYAYVEDLGDDYGVVSTAALNILEWVSDEEADRLERESGLFKTY